MKIFVGIFTAILLPASFVSAQSNVNKSSANKPLKIISKPRAEYPKQDTGTICATGIVRLRIRFLDSGRIGEIEPLNKLPYGLTESAINAAQEIKFNPEIREGKSVTVTKVIEYNFSIY